MTTVESAKQKIMTAGYTITAEKRLGNETGWQLELKTGQKISIFDNGNINVQGKNTTELKKIFEQNAGNSQSSAISRKVFVVYGHDNTARIELEAMLRRWGIEPLILDQLPSEGMTVIEKLERYGQQVNFAVVLSTPDDEGHRTGHPDEKALRARQNVVLELGMMLARLGRARVAILLKDQEKMERPSDIQGLIYIPYKDTVNDAALKLALARELNAQGLSIDSGKI